MAQQVKYLALSLQQLRPLLWHGFNPYSFMCCGHSQKKKKEKEKRIYPKDNKQTKTHTYLKSSYHQTKLRLDEISLK